MAPVNSIVRAVSNYTDDVLRAIGKAKVKPEVLNINGQVHTFVHKPNGSLHIVKDEAGGFFQTNLTLASGDRFERSVQNGLVSKHQLKMSGLDMNSLPTDPQSIASTENIFKQMLNIFLG